MRKKLVLLSLLPIFLFSDANWINKSLHKTFSEANFNGLKEKIERLESLRPNLLDEIQCFRVCIINNRPYFSLPNKLDPKSWVVKSFEKAIYEACAHNTFKDCVFYISHSDLVNPGHLSEVEGFPVLTSTKHISMKNSIPIPDQEALRMYKDIAKKKDPDNFVTNLSNRIEFKKKMSIALFRGTNSGCDRELKVNARSNDWYKSARGQLVYESVITDSKLVNARFTDFRSENLDLEKTMLSSKFRSARVPVKNQVLSRYLIDIDGWGCTYSRLYWILGSKSVCLKVKSDLEQWYYPGLLDRVHLFYIQPNIESAESCVIYLNKNDSIAESVANNAHEFFKIYLNQSFQRLYFAKVLSLYSELYNQNFSILETLK
jgi:hypothetical protein